MLGKWQAASLRSAAAVAAQLQPWAAPHKSMRGISSVICFVSVLLALVFYSKEIEADNKKVSPPPFEIRLAYSAAIKGTVPMKLPDRDEVVHVVSEAGLTIKEIQQASASTDQYGRPSIEIILTKEGFEKMLAFTKENVGKQAAIFIDGKLLMAPSIDGPVKDGKLMITGVLSEAQVQAVVNGLKRK